MTLNLIQLKNKDLTEEEEAYYQLFLLCEKESKFYKDFKFRGISLFKYNHTLPEVANIIVHKSFKKLNINYFLMK